MPAEVAFTREDLIAVGTRELVVRGLQVMLQSLGVGVFAVAFGTPEISVNAKGVYACSH